MTHLSSFLAGIFVGGLFIGMIGVHLSMEPMIQAINNMTDVMKNDMVMLPVSKPKVRP